MRKDEYLKALKGMETVDEAVDVPVDAPAAPKAEKAAKPVEAATTNTPAEPVAPAEPELFPGFSALPEERRTEIKERWRLADEAKTREEELKKVRHEYNLVHQRLAPTQQQVSKMQLEHVKLQKELSELRAAKQSSLSAETKTQLDAYRQVFPDEAKMMETLVNPVLSQAEAAKSYAAALEEKVKTIEQRLWMDEQKQVLSSAHPDWMKKRATTVQDEQGNVSVRRIVNTPEAEEFEVWANALDPYEKERVWPLLRSPNAQDAIYVLNRFEQDRHIAAQLLGQQNATAPAAVAAPVADPDPARRATAPARPAGQPKSDKQRELEAAAEYLRKAGKLPQKRRA